MASLLLGILKKVCGWHKWGRFRPWTPTAIANF